MLMRFSASLVLATTVAAAVIVAAAPQSRTSRQRGTPIAIQAAAVPLNPDDRSQSAVGPFTYAGGLVLTSMQTDQLHGLSDLEFTGSDRITAVSDDGIFLTARVVLDRTGRLVGVDDARLEPLTGLDGRPLANKEEADSEGLALLPNGDRLVSFERQHRIWRYPADGGPPRPVPQPEVSFPVANGGMEALAPDPSAGTDAYVVGAELTGETWTCRISTTCVKGPTVPRPSGLSLVALRRLAGGRTAFLLRGFAQATGSRIALIVMRGNGVDAQLDLTRPLTVDNFEGVAAVARPNGVIRFYLISDDNGSATQRTLLLAFDWRPAADSR
jgi:hypothetical protein